MMFPLVTGIAQSTDSEGHQALQDQRSSWELKDILESYSSPPSNSEASHSLASFYDDGECGLPEDSAI